MNSTILCDGHAIEPAELTTNNELAYGGQSTPSLPAERKLVGRIDLASGPRRVINVDMRTTKQQQRAVATPGFAIQITPDTDLGNAMLIVEDEEGHHAPIAIAMTINEAKELAQDDLRNRMRSIENGTNTDGLCPYEYKLWARGLGGVQTVAATWAATGL